MTNEQKLLAVAAVGAAVIYLSKTKAVAGFGSNSGGVMGGDYTKYRQRGIRNNNPGNLVLTNIPWLGKVPNSKNTDGHFEQFNAPEYGIRAMFMDVRGDITKDGKNTLNKLIPEYAPKFENNTAAYIAFISKEIGKGANEALLPSDYFKLLRSIIKMENGIQPYPDDLIKKGMALA